jgi:hypothetical protein
MIIGLPLTASLWREKSIMPRKSAAQIGLGDNDPNVIFG